MNTTFQFASRDLYHVLVVCDLTQIPAEPIRDQDL